MNTCPVCSCHDRKSIGSRQLHECGGREKFWHHRLYSISIRGEIAWEAWGKIIGANAQFYWILVFYGSLAIHLDIRWGHLYVAVVLLLYSTWSVWLFALIFLRRQLVQLWPSARSRDKRAIRGSRDSVVTPNRIAMMNLVDVALSSPFSMACLVDIRRLSAFRPGQIYLKFVESLQSFAAESDIMSSPRRRFLCHAFGDTVASRADGSDEVVSTLCMASQLSICQLQRDRRQKSVRSCGSHQRLSAECDSMWSLCCAHSRAEGYKEGGGGDCAYYSDC